MRCNAEPFSVFPIRPVAAGSVGSGHWVAVAV